MYNVPRFFIPQTGFDPTVIPKYFDIISSLNSQLSVDYNVLIEFTVPNGREIDFLILHKTGGWLIEHKSHNFVELRVNGPWKFLNRKGKRRRFVKHIMGRTENPFQQAQNSGDSFTTWLKNQTHLSPDLRIQRSIFPCVAFPDSNSNITVIEQYKWIYWSKGIEGIMRNISKRHWNRKAYLSDSTINLVIKELQLQEISYSDLIQFGTAIENIFRDVGLRQIAEIKQRFLKTNQLNQNKNWSYILGLTQFNGNHNLPIQDLSLNELPLILTGDFGSGKTILSYQIMEQLLVEDLGFFIPLREFFTWKDSENSLFYSFKGHYQELHKNYFSESSNLIEEETLTILASIIKTLIGLYKKPTDISPSLKGIKTYLEDQRFFLILDGWDEIQGGSYPLINKIQRFLVTSEIPFIISCRTPLPNMLKKIKINHLEIPIYIPQKLKLVDSETYIQQRSLVWNQCVSVEKLIKTINDTTPFEINPFKLFIRTTSPLFYLSNNQFQLFRGELLYHVAWELFKDRRDYLEQIDSFDSLSDILKNEEIYIGKSKTNYYSAIFDVPYEGDLELSNASVIAILGKFAVLTYRNLNHAITLTSYLEINPLIESFITQIHHPKTLYLYPSFKSQYYQENFLLEFALYEFIQHQHYSPLFRYDLYLQFQQLLNFDERWKSSLPQIQSGKIEYILAQFLITNPIQLQPTIILPKTESIGGGMRFIQNRMQLGIPGWYKDMLLACIVEMNRIKQQTVLKVNNLDQIEAFLKIQSQIPEMTSDTLYDSFVHDYEYGHISVSKEPRDFFKTMEVIFSRFRSKQPFISHFIEKYRRMLKRKTILHKIPQKIKNFFENRKEEVDFFNIQYGNYHLTFQDNQLFDKNYVDKLYFLFALLEFSVDKNLHNWANAVLYSLSLSGKLIEFLLGKCLNENSISILLGRYHKLCSDWVDEELGCTQPPEHSFNEEKIFQSFYFHLRRNQNESIIKKIWTLLVHFTEDLNLTEFLHTHQSEIHVELFLELCELLHQQNSYKKNALSHLLSQYERKLYPIKGDKIEDYNKKLTENLKAYNNAQEEKEETLPLLINSQKDEFKSEQEKREISRRIYKIEATPSELMIVRYNLYYNALISEISINFLGLADVLSTFAQVRKIMAALKSKYLKISPIDLDQLIGQSPHKIQAYFSLLGENNEIPSLIAFYRLSSNSIFNTTINKFLQSDTSFKGSTWLKTSEMNLKKKNGGNSTRNPDLIPEWEEIERFVKEKHSTLLNRDAFLRLLKIVLDVDNNQQIKVDLFAEILFNSFDTEINTTIDWEKLNNCLNIPFLTELSKISLTERFVSATSWSFLLHLYPYHQKHIGEVILGRFQEEPSEFDQVNIYRSFFFALSTRLLQFEYFELYSELIHQIPNQYIDFLVSSIRHIMFPEDNDEILQISTILSEYGQSHKQDLKNLIEKLVDRVLVEIIPLYNSNKDMIYFSYFCDLIVGIKPENLSGFLLSLVSAPIYEDEIGIWLLRDKDLILSGKETFFPVFEKELKRIKAFRTEDLSEFEREKLNRNIMIFQDFAEALRSPTPHSFPFRKKIDYKKFSQQIKIDFETYVPYTATLDFNDFWSSILPLKKAQKVSIFIRFLFGKNIHIKFHKINFSGLFFTRKSRYRLFPISIENGIKNLIAQLGIGELVPLVREFFINNKPYFFACMNYLVENLKMIDSQKLLNSLTPVEIEELRLEIFKFIEANE